MARTEPPIDNRVVFLAVMPADLMRKLEDQFGDRIRARGDMFTTDLMQDTEAELSDEAVKVTVTIKRKRGG